MRFFANFIDIESFTLCGFWNVCMWTIYITVYINKSCRKSYKLWYQMKHLFSTKTWKSKCNLINNLIKLCWIKFILDKWLESLMNIGFNAIITCNKCTSLWQWINFWKKNETLSVYYSVPTQEQMGHHRKTFTIHLYIMLQF